MMTIRTLAVLATLLGCAVPAQETWLPSYFPTHDLNDPRSRYLYSVTQYIPWNRVDDEVNVIIQSDRDTTLKWLHQKLTATGPGPEVWTQFTVPYDRPGSVLELPADHLLVSGYDENGAQGFIVKLKLVKEPAPQIIKVAEIAMPGFDPIDMVRNRWERRLYVVDNNGRELHCASFPNYMAPLPQLGISTVVANALTLPALALPAWEDYGVVGNDPNPGVTFIASGGEGVVGRAERSIGIIAWPRYGVSQQPGGPWVVSAHSVFDLLLTPTLGYAVHHANYVGTKGKLLVKGPGGPFSIIDSETGQIAHSASLVAIPEWWKTDDADLTTWQEIDLAAAGVVTGRRYHLVNAADPTFVSRTFHPIIRNGKATTMTAGGITFSMLQGQVNAWLLSPGKEVTTVNEIEAAPGFLGQPVDCTLFLALRGPDGIDPVEDIGGGVYLLTESFYSVGPKQSVGFNSELDQLLPTMRFGIDDDPALVGNVLLMQYVVSSGDSAMVSDVFGSVIVPENEPEAAALFAGRRALPALTMTSRLAGQRWRRTKLGSASGVGTALLFQALYTKVRSTVTQQRNR